MSMSDLIRSDSMERLPVSGSVRIDRTIMSSVKPYITQEQIEASRSRLAVIGYSRPQGSHKTLGQVTIENHEHDVVFVTSLPEHFGCHNTLSIFPLLNVYTAIDKISRGIFSSEPDKSYSMINHVIEEDYTKYRVILVLTGIAELTLVGGWLLHGGMTLYYYSHTNGNA